MTGRRATILAIATTLMAASTPAQEVEPGVADAPALEAEQDAADAPLSEQESLDALFSALREAGPQEARRIERRIMGALSVSGSDSMDFLLSRGRAAMEAEAHDKAVEHLSALVRLAPDFAEAWNLRATAHFLAKDYWASMADIQRVLTLEPRHFGALSGLASILEQTGDAAGALRAHRAALAVNPHIEGAREAVERLAREVDGSDI